MSNNNQSFSVADQLRDEVLEVLDTLDIAPGIIDQFKQDTDVTSSKE